MSDKIRDIMAISKMVSEYNTQIKALENQLEEKTETAKERFDAIQNYEKQNLRLVIENNKMREALEFYAGEKNHTSCTVKVMNHYETPIEYDLGKRAREALRHKL